MKRRIATATAIAVSVAVGFAGCGGSTARRTASAEPSAGTTTAGPLVTLRVPSSSMSPTISAGQTVTALLARGYVPQVGDIVIFHPPVGADPVTPVCGSADQGAGHPQVCSAPTPSESSQLFLKRVVAAPGDTISMRDGHVIRNGVEEHDSTYTEPCGSDPSCTWPTTVTIPSSDYFMVGDNRGASDDSRFWGPVPRAWIVGKVEQ